MEKQIKENNQKPLPPSKVIKPKDSEFKDASLKQKVEDVIKQNKLYVLFRYKFLEYIINNIISIFNILIWSFIALQSFSFIGVSLNMKNFISTVCLYFMVGEIRVFALEMATRLGGKRK